MKQEAFIMNEYRQMVVEQVKDTNTCLGRNQSQDGFDDDATLPQSSQDALKEVPLVSGGTRFQLSRASHHLKFEHMVNNRSIAVARDPYSSDRKHSSNGEIQIVRKHRRHQTPCQCRLQQRPPEDTCLYLDAVRMNSRDRLE